MPIRRKFVHEGARLVFAQVAGSAELWVDGLRMAQKADPAIGPMEAVTPPGAKDVALLVRSVAGQPSGLIAPVRAERRA